MEEVIVTPTGSDSVEDSLGNEGDFIWAYRPHPLCIPHIVDNIQNYLNVPDLKSCRLVNSQYNEIACHSLARKEVVTFNKFAKLSSYISYIPISASLSQFTCTAPTDEADTGEVTPTAKCDTLEGDTPSKQFGNEYAHSSFHFKFDPKAVEAPKVAEFFDTFGSNIRELRYTTDLIPYMFPMILYHMGDVWKGRLENVETLILELKWGIPPNLYEKEAGAILLPSVRKLVLDILVTEREADRATNFLQQLLASTPNVEEITIPGNKKFFDDYVHVILGRIVLSSDLSRLTALNFCLAFNESDVRALADKNLPLKSLILDFAEMPYFALIQDENNNENNGNLRPILNNQGIIRALQTLFHRTAPTLKDLYLCFPYNSAHCLHRFVFPEPMVSLTHLALGGFYGSVTILDKLPVIKKLDLWNVVFHDFDYEGRISAQVQGEEIRADHQRRFVPEKYLGVTNVIS